MTPFPAFTHTRRRQSLAALLAGALWLSGCVNPPAFHPDASMTQQAWSGRMGLQVHDTDAQAQAQSFSASFQLQGSPERGTLDIFNPLGSQIAQLRWQPGTAQLQQGDQLRDSASLQALLQQSLGTALPIQAIFSWLQGQAATAPGWEVDLSRHAQGRITAQRTMPLPQATLRIVLQSAE
jgi:outer membrane lipoprotein LolB